MQKTVPSLLKSSMKPTMNGASPELEKSTWKIDMANAMTLAISNLFDMVQFSWFGQVVGPGTTSYPMAGVGGQIITPVPFTPIDVQAACVGETSVVGLFTLIGGRLEQPLMVNLGYKVGKILVPYILTPQLLKFTSTMGSVTAVFTKAGADCYNELKKIDPQTYVDKQGIFYDVFDKHLAQAFGRLIGTMVIGGPTSSGGVLAGSCQVKTVATVIGTP